MTTAQPTELEKQAERVVETACAQMIDCPCGCNREATATLFSEMPDEELLFDVPTCSRRSPTPHASKSCSPS